MRRSPDARAWGGRCAAVACLLAALLAIALVDRLRALEAALGARVVQVAMGAGSHPPSSALVSYPVGGGRFRALEVTWQASSVAIAVPILAVSALACLLPRARPQTVVARAAAGIVVVAGANQLRLLVIAAATARWGDDGFLVAQQLVGSGIVVVSVGATVVAVARARPTPRPPSA